MLPDNTVRLTLAPDSDPACAELSALALLLVPRSAADAVPKRAGGRPPGLSMKTEVRPHRPFVFSDGRLISQCILLYTQHRRPCCLAGPLVCELLLPRPMNCFVRPHACTT